jgi:hypothetical protein
MAKISMQYDVTCSVDTFWRLFLDRQFNTTLYNDRLKFNSYEIVEQTETPLETRRTIKGEPPLDAPAMVQKVLGSKFGYVEAGRWDKQTRVWKWTMTPGMLADKFNATGELRVEACGSTCRMHVDVEIEARILGIGGLVASTAEKNIRNGWDRSAAFFNEYTRPSEAESPAA